MIIDATLQTLCGCEQKKMIEVDERTFGPGYEYKVALHNPRENFKDDGMGDSRDTCKIRYFVLYHCNPNSRRALLIEKGE